MEIHDKDSTNTASLKLIKNSRGYNWEIKILEIDIEKLEKLNNEMIKLYGGEKNEDD